MENAVTYGDIIPFKMGVDRVFQINHPKYIEEILLTRHKEFRKASNHKRFREVLGDGLLTSNGSKWKQDRQRIQPVFRRDLVEGPYLRSIISASIKLKNKWEYTGCKSGQVNVTEDMARLTLSILFDTIFGSEISEKELDEVDKAIKIFMDYVGLPRVFPAVDLNKVFFRPNYRNLHKVRESLKELIRDIYKRELKHPSSRINMMRLLIDSVSNDAGRFTFEDIYDHTITMFFAGYETTATMLQWAWLCLDQNPNVQEELLSKIEGLDPSDSDYWESLNKIEYLDAFIKEVMRLYPSFWATTRAPNSVINLGDQRISPFHTLLLPQHVMHRHPRFWDNPDIFDPDRFLEKNSTKIVNGSYFPFSLGHRKCIGYRLAEMEAKIIIATLLPSFVLKRDLSRSYELKPIISLRLEEDLVMQISKRKNSSA